MDYLIATKKFAMEGMQAVYGKPQDRGKFLIKYIMPMMPGLCDT